MADVSIVERDVSATEFERVRALERADANTRGDEDPARTRLTVVAEAGGAMVGCAVLAMHWVDDAPGWAYLEELFVERPYRRRGLGAALLGAIEARAYALGVRAVWTRTAGYEAPGFYLRQGYARCFVLPEYFRSRHALVGLRKTLTPRSPPAQAAGLALDERALTASERARVERGFVEHGLLFENPESTSERVGFVALERDALIGCASGLAYRDAAGVLPWFFITNLIVAPDRRGRGVGRALARALERRVVELGTPRAWTQLPSYWDLEFLHGRGFKTLSTFDGWSPGGAAYVTLAASLPARAPPHAHASH